MTAVIERATITKALDSTDDIARALKNSTTELEELAGKWLYSGKNKRQLAFENMLRSRCADELIQMELTVERIGKAEYRQLEEAYYHPKSSAQLATAIHSRFVDLSKLTQEEAAFALAARLDDESATVYDVRGCERDMIWDIIQKGSVHSIINVDPDLVEDIPKNDHQNTLHWNSHSSNGIVIDGGRFKPPTHRHSTSLQTA